MTTKVWLVRFTYPDCDADGSSFSLHPVSFTTRADAEYEGCCHWAGPAGRGIAALHIQAVDPGTEPDQDRWETVAPASTCGGVRDTGLSVVKASEGSRAAGKAAPVGTRVAA